MVRNLADRISSHANLERGATGLAGICFPTSENRPPPKGDIRTSPDHLPSHQALALQRTDSDLWVGGVGSGAERCGLATIHAAIGPLRCV